MTDLHAIWNSIQAVAEGPVITWNLFFNVIALPALGWWITTQIKRIDILQTKNMELWQEGARERSSSLNEKIDKLDRCISSIKEDIDKKVEDHDCEVRVDRIWTELNRLRDKV